jgi:hypothetical protein
MKKKRGAVQGNEAARGARLYLLHGEMKDARLTIELELEMQLGRASCAPEVTGAAVVV